MLYQQGDEPLETPKNSSVDDDRTMLPIILADVFELKSLRQLVVKLDRCTLPIATDGVNHMKIDLRTVEIPFSLGDPVGLVSGVKCLF